MKLVCKYLGSCRGCPLGHLDFDQQKTLKKNKFKERLNSAFSPSALSSTEFVYVFPVFSDYRTRVDFIYSDGKLGWLDHHKKFLPIDECQLHTAELTLFAKEIMAIPWSVRRGSMRLRVSPENTRGLWLDFANLDIKQILSNSVILESLFKKNIIVEVGQKGKRVIRTGVGFKLSDPIPYPWFKTEFQKKSVELNSLISSFTQTNPDLNVQMIDIVKSFFKDMKFDEIIEFGSGVGNFTLFLTEYTAQLNVIENDFRNLVPLRSNLARYGLTEKVKIFENFNSFSKSKAQGTNKSLYFVNPARSGVGALFDSVIPAKNVVYISCHLDSFLADSVKLTAQGFKPSKAILFDQFPHSEHFEILSYFKKD